MMSCNRCISKVFDNSTKRERRCKKNKVNWFDYCFTHMKVNYESSIILIQSIYRGYYTRRKLKIFYKLPRDIQRIVIYNINKDIYHKHFNASITKLIKRKFINFYKNDQYNSIMETAIRRLYYFDVHWFHHERIELDFYKDLNNLIKLTIKYQQIIDLTDNRKFRPIKSYCEYYLRFLNNNNMFDFENENLNIYTYFKFIKICNENL